MSIEISLNTIDNNFFWYELGISFQKVEYHPTHRYVLTLALVFFSIYFRFVKR